MADGSVLNPIAEARDREEAVRATLAAVAEGRIAPGDFEEAAPSLVALCDQAIEWLA